MKATITLLLLPAALAWPSYNGHSHGYGHKAAYKSGPDHVSGAQLPSGTATGPFDMHNATATQADTVANGAGSITPTQHLTSQNIVSVTASDQAPIEAATAVAGTDGAGASGTGAGGAGGACSETATVTVANTVTVTINGGAGAQAAKTAAPETQAPVASAPVQQSPAPAPVAPVSQAASPVEQAATPSPSSATTAPAVQAAAATPATAASAPQVQSGASSGSKRGIIASGADQDHLVSAFNNAGKISWLANWYSAPPKNLSPKIEFVPQMYDKFSDKNNEWTINAKKAISAGDKYFLSFGEPETQNDQGFQMDPQTAASTWMQYFQPYTGSVTCGAPGVLQNTQDLTWLSQFMDACDKLGCKIGFVAIHWFYKAEAGNEQGFKDVINKVAAIANGRPVWVDNFRADGTNAAQQAFLADIVPWLEANTAVARYAYASPDRSTGTGFLNADGSMSSLGTFYSNL